MRDHKTGGEDRGARTQRPGATRFVVVTLVLATAVAGGVVELGARWLGVSPPIELGFNLVSDPFLPWKPRPGSSVSGMSRSQEFFFNRVHNSQGFRDTDHAFRRPPGVFRIVALGDSFTYGVGVEYEDTYLVKLEEKLNRTSPTQVEIVKLGVPRFWPEAERLMLEHYGLRYQPHLVLVGLVPNDVYDTITGIEGRKVSQGFLVTRRAERLGTKVQWLYTHSYAFRAVLSRLLRHSESGEPEEKVEEKEGAWRRIYAELGKMVQLARGAGAEIVFVHIPQKPPWGPRAVNMPQRLERFCEDEDCHVVDVLPEMKKAALEPGRLYYPKDGHCTALGYEIVARVIYGDLVEHARVPVAALGP